MRLFYIHSSIYIKFSIKRKKLTNKSIRFSGVKICAFCFQIHPESYEWNISVRSDSGLRLLKIFLFRLDRL